MYMAVIEKFIQRAQEQNAEVRLLEGNDLGKAILEVARGAGASTFSVSGELGAEVAETLSGAGLKKTDLSADMAITGSPWAIAETGTVVVAGSRSIFITADIHVVVANSSSIVADLDDVPYSEALEPPFTLVTGPSRTSDIERVLVLGAHGPRRLVILIIEP